jgi:hypothetical protein
VVGLQQGWASRPVVLEEKASRDGKTGALSDSLILSEVGVGLQASTIWTTEKVGTRPISALLADYASLTVRGDTLCIGGASPPRVERLVRDSSVPDVTDMGGAVLLRGTPVRPLSRKDRDNLQRDARRAGVDSAGAEVAVYPAVARAWALPDGFAVLAGTGASTFAIDRYCGNRFAATTLSGPDIADVAWLPSVVVVRRSATARSGARLEFYTPAQLASSCGSAR